MHRWHTQSWCSSSKWLIHFWSSAVVVAVIHLLHFCFVSHLIFPCFCHFSCHQEPHPWDTDKQAERLWRLQGRAQRLHWRREFWWFFIRIQTGVRQNMWLLIGCFLQRVTPENFLAVLRGDSAKAKGKVIKRWAGWVQTWNVPSSNHSLLDSGRGVMHLCPLCLGSGPNDHVFVYFTDHGAPGILAFPNDDVSTSVLPAAASVSLTHSLPLIKISESKVMSFNELSSSFQTCIYSNVAEHFETPVNYFDNETRNLKFKLKYHHHFPITPQLSLCNNLRSLIYVNFWWLEIKTGTLAVLSCFLSLLIIHLFIINVCLTLTWWKCKHVFHIFVQLAVKDLQDTIQYMYKNKKYKRVSRAGAFIDFCFLTYILRTETHQVIKLSVHNIWLKL